jgi:hypothetical protein
MDVKKIVDDMEAAGDLVSLEQEVRRLHKRATEIRQMYAARADSASAAATAANLMLPGPLKDAAVAAAAKDVAASANVIASWGEKFR